MTRDTACPFDDPAETVPPLNNPERPYAAWSTYLLEIQLKTARGEDRDAINAELELRKKG